MPESNVYLPLGLLLHNWHNGMDAVYGVGSNLVAGQDATPEQVDEAIAILEFNLFDFKGEEKAELESIIKRLKNYKMYLEFAPDEFEKGYIECAIWLLSDFSEDGDSDSNETHGPYDLAPSTLAWLREELKGFRESFAKELEATEASDSQNGHDLWLTRNRHGAGFWDRGYDEMVSDAITDSAKSLGSADWYVGDDGLVYEMGSENFTPST